MGSSELLRKLQWARIRDKLRQLWLCQSASRLLSLFSVWNDKFHTTSGKQRDQHGGEFWKGNCSYFHHFPGHHHRHGTVRECSGSRRLWSFPEIADRNELLHSVTCCCWYSGGSSVHASVGRVPHHWTQVDVRFMGPTGISLITSYLKLFLQFLLKIPIQRL